MASKEDFEWVEQAFVEVERRSKTDRLIEVLKAEEPEQAIVLFAFWVWRSLTNQRDRTIVAVVVMVATGAGIGIGVALRVGLTLALVGVPLDHFFPRQNPIQQQHHFNPGYLIRPELWDIEEG